MSTINLKPRRPTLHARDLDVLINLYLESLAARVQLSTLTEYSLRLAPFRQWWALVGPSQEWMLTEEDMRRFEFHLRHLSCQRFDRPLSYHSRNDILRRLRQMFRWAHRRRHIEDLDCSLWVPAPDGAPTKRRSASMTELRRLFLAAQTSSTPTRDSAILALLIGTGMRRGELTSLRIENITFTFYASGTCTVKGKRTRANRNGVRTLAFDAATGSYLKSYLLELNERNGPLWPNREGEPLTDQTIYRIVKRLIADAGLTGTLQGCHDLRRAFATHYNRMHRGEGHADLLRRQMGHTSYRQTADYDLTDADDIRDTLVSPLSRIADDHR